MRLAKFKEKEQKYCLGEAKRLSQPFQNPNGTLSFERLRVLGLPRYTGVQVSHAGSGEVLPPFLGSHPPSVNNGFNAPYVGDSATHQSGAWVAYHQEFIAACKAGMTFHVKNASYVDYRNPRYYKEVNMNNCRKPNDVTVAKVKQVCEGKSQATWLGVMGPARLNASPPLTRG